MSIISVIARKEIVDNLRDKRAMSTALLVPLLGPLAMFAVFFAVKDAEVRARNPVVPVIGAEHAPLLVEYMVRQGVEVKAPPANPEEAVKKGEVPLVVRIPEGFGDAVRKGDPALVEIICDPSQQRSGPVLMKMERILEGWGQQVGAMRLMVRGVDPQVMRALRVERVDVSSPEAKRALLLGTLPVFLLMACFIGGTYVAIDLTAGERERGSLEPLLLNPVSPWTFIIAKAIATFAFCLLSVVVGLAAFTVILPLIPFDEMGLHIQLKASTGLGWLVLYLPATFLAAAFQLFVGAASKTTKTAQSALGIILLVPVAPAMIVTLFPQQPALTNMIVPFLGESILAMRLLRGEPIEVLHWLANAGATTLLGVVLVGVTGKLFGPRMLSG